ncbi:hypothetical protein [Thiocystis violacea]|uniref:hypothetical protein n=1 Tax=Thiocystis violacea TaxID=13725 RepID=UPI00190608A7|nr:hypothetical protein [Thiocystis violacea]MBK1719761.1 hypothetical protein [Thiocystis violacea]
MEVFIGNLPGQATLGDLVGFLQGIELRTDFRFQRGRDRDNRDYHFVVARAATREEGLALIARLNGQLFEGHLVEAREYRRRAIRLGWPGAERRVNRL